MNKDIALRNWLIFYHMEIFAKNVEKNSSAEDQNLHFKQTPKGFKSGGPWWTL